MGITAQFLEMTVGDLTGVGENGLLTRGRALTHPNWGEIDANDFYLGQWRIQFLRSENRYNSQVVGAVLFDTFFQTTRAATEATATQTTRETFSPERRRS